MTIDDWKKLIDEWAQDECFLKTADLAAAIDRRHKEEVLEARILEHQDKCLSCYTEPKFCPRRRDLENQLARLG